jgi:hypothetical protein
VEIASPAVSRIQRPGWRDPRLGLGILLVASSVALGAWTLERAEDGVALYAARGVLTPGEQVTTADLAVVEARVPGVAGVYLSADQPLPRDAVVIRVVGPDELVPADAIGRPDEIDMRPVTITPGSLSASVVEGAVVDLWLTSSAERTVGSSAEPAEPVLLAEALRVADVRVDESLFAAAGRTSVEVLVPEARLPVVLKGLGRDGELVLVPRPGGA